MYGMVNNAFRRYVIENDGEDAWAEIVSRSALDESEFAAMQPYDDGVTLAIVGAIVERSGRGVEEVLRDVGRYWVGFAKTTTFAKLLAMAGQDLATLIANLDDMHARIQTSLPTMQPPAFSCRRIEDDSGEELLEITYESERDGLFPFVLGIFEGLAEEFGHPLEVAGFEQTSSSAGRWQLKVPTEAERAA